MGGGRQGRERSEFEFSCGRRLSKPTGRGPPKATVLQAPGLCAWSKRLGPRWHLRSGADRVAPAGWGRGSVDTRRGPRAQRVLSRGRCVLEGGHGVGGAQKTLPHWTASALGSLAAGFGERMHLDEKDDRAKITKIKRKNGTSSLCLGLHSLVRGPPAAF